jgi:hypothetical protein
MALSLSVILLGGMAIAFNAAMVNFTENKDVYRAVTSARGAMKRMTQQLRTGYWIDPNAPVNQCNFYTSTGEDLTFEFRSSDNTLYLITNSNGNEYVLCRNATDVDFIKTPNSDSTDCTSVQISLTVQQDNVLESLSSAVAIRRNLE